MKWIITTAVLIASTASAEPLRILNWADYIDIALIDEFQTETGITIAYDTYDNAEAVEAKLMAGGSNYDLVVISSEYLERLISSEKIIGIDPAKLANFDNLWADIITRVNAFDHGGNHAIPYLWGTSGLGYDATKILDRMPDAPLDSWSLLFDPEIVAHFADCGVSVIDTPEEMLAIALTYLGHDPNSHDEAEIEAALHAIGKILPYVATVNAEQYDDLAAGDVCLALVWSGDALAAAEDAVEGVEISYTIPVEGAPIWFDLFVMPSDAVNIDQAHVFLDYMLRPDVIARATNLLWYPNANAAATELVDEEILNDPTIYPTPEILERLFPVEARPPVEKSNIARAWRRLRLGL